MICEKCEHLLEVDMSTAEIIDIASNGAWVYILLDWYCPVCDEYKGTFKEYFEAQ